MKGCLFNTVDDALITVRQTKPGEVLLYHRGELCLDRRYSRLVNDVAELMLELGTAKDKKVRPEYPGAHHKMGKGWGSLYQVRLKPVPPEDTIVTEYYIRRYG